MKRRMVKSGLQLAVAVALVAFATLARAGTGTLELGLGTAYTRGIGPVRAGMPSLQHVAGDGGALRLDVAWRFDPSWSLGCYQEGSLFGAGHTAGVDRTTGVAGGIEGRFHADPLARLDPWVGLGVGWRGVSIDHGTGTHAILGVDLARVQVGLDYRLSPRFTVAPTIGLAVTEFLWERVPGASDYTALSDREIGTFVFAGLSGRVDVFSTRG